MIKSYVKILSICLVISMTISCRTTPPGGDVSSCPTVQQEAVSTCRAEAQCKSKKTQYSMGLGYNTPARESLSPTTQEMNLARSPTTDNYAKCIQKSLKEQEALNNMNEDEKQINNDAVSGTK